LINHSFDWFILMLFWKSIFAVLNVYLIVLFVWFWILFFFFCVLFLFYYWILFHCFLNVKIGAAKQWINTLFLCKFHKNGAHFMWIIIGKWTHKLFFLSELCSCLFLGTLRYQVFKSSNQSFLLEAEAHSKSIILTLWIYLFISSLKTSKAIEKLYGKISWYFLSSS